MRQRWGCLWWAWGFPADARGTELAYQCRRHKRHWFNPWVGKIPWSRSWQPTPVFLPGESHGQRSLEGYSPWGHKESDTTEWRSINTGNLKWFLWWLSSKESTCKAGDLGSSPGLGKSPGGGHGNPLQYSHLENPMGRGAWKATVHGVAKSWTRLKRQHAHMHARNL